MARSKRDRRSRREKVLRIGIIRGPRIVDERLIRTGHSVTVGSSERNDFVLPPSHLPPRHRLFEMRSDGYYLAFDERMRGKVFSGGTVLPLQDLAGRAARHKGAVHWTRLRDGDRGKIQIGDSIVLFQFVQAPPEPRRVPMSFSPLCFAQMDWVFWCFVMFSMVLNTAGYLYIDSRPLPSQMSISDVPERFADVWFTQDDLDALMPPDPLEGDDPTLETPTPGPDEGPSAESDAVAEAENGPSEPSEMIDAETLRNMRREELRSMGLAAALIPTNSDNNSGDAVIDLLAESDRLADNLDVALNRSGEIHVARSNDTAPGTRQSGGGSGEAGTFTSTGGFESGDAGDDARVQREVKPMCEPETEYIDPGVDSRSVSDVVESKKGSVQRCYERYLSGEPDLQGKVEVLIVVGPDGVVSEVRIPSNSTESADLARCIARSIRRWQFPATGDEYEVSYRFNLFPG